MIRRNTEVKMKKFISLALILVLTLICGVQIAADSAETYAMCRHPHSTYVISGYSTTVDKDCLLYYYEYDVEQCTVCNKTLSMTLTKSYIIKDTHEYKSDANGDMICVKCRAKL